MMTFLSKIKERAGTFMHHCENNCGQSFKFNIDKMYNIDIKQIID